MTAYNKGKNPGDKTVNLQRITPCKTDVTTHTTGEMTAEERIDKFLWSVRLYKSRSIATEECRKGRVSSAVNRPNHLIITPGQPSPSGNRL
jgi:hypothetical protein